MPRGKSGLELGHDERILCPAARDDELIDLVFRKDEAVEGVDDGQGCEDGDCADEIGGANVMVAPCGEQVFDVSGSVVFAAGALRRLLRQIWIVHEFISKRGCGAARSGELGVFVETLATASEMLDESVDENVGRTGVEGEDLRRFAGSGQDGDVGDAAEI